MDSETTVTRELENTIVTLGSLCVRCNITPWGEEGWKEFWTGETSRAQSLAWMSAPQNDSITRNMIDYDLDLNHLCSTPSLSCAWCSVIKTMMGFGSTATDSERLRERLDVQRIDAINMSLSFWAKEGTAPSRLSRIHQRGKWHVENRFGVFSEDVDVIA